MYDEGTDFAEHRSEMVRMDAALEECGAAVDWASAVVCDVGGGGALRAGLLARRARRAHCADVIDQQARYAGEFVKLQAEKFQRHGEELPIDRFEFNVTDAMRLMYRDDWFDFVCAVNTFEHIPDPTRALAEIARVLRPGALAYITFDPIWTADTGSHFQRHVPEPWAHLLLDESEFVRRMRAAGAADTEVEDFGTRSTTSACPSTIDCSACSPPRWASTCCCIARGAASRRRATWRTRTSRARWRPTRATSC